MMENEQTEPSNFLTWQIGVALSIPLLGMWVPFVIALAVNAAS